MSATQTTNLGLNKPDRSDYVSVVNDLNDNMDIIDGAYGDLATGKVPSTRKVNGHALSSDVTVTKGDVGLGNVNNTSDANKPISNAQALVNTNTANQIIDLKSAISNGYGGDTVPTAARTNLLTVYPQNGSIVGSGSNYMMAVPCKASTEYFIERTLKTTRMVVCQFNAIPAVNSSYTDLYEWVSSDADRIKIKTGASTTYFLVGIWNSSLDSSIDKTNFFATISSNVFVCAVLYW